MLYSALTALALLATTQGATTEDFCLLASDGARVSLYAAPEGTRATVVTMTTLECPIARLLLPRLAEMERAYHDRGVRFLAIDPNAHDTASAITARRDEVGVDFPILRDPFHVVCDRLGVTRTAEVFVYDADFTLVYRGAVDDQYSEGARRPAPTHTWLRDALDSTLRGAEPTVTETEVQGCLLGPAHGEGEVAAVTYHRDVAPILDAHCVECHRDGQIGPMSLTDPRTARSFAPMIAEVVTEGRMPPWYADSRHGRFTNERRLTDTDKATLVAWADASAPLGEPTDAASTTITFDDGGWTIGEPDLILQLPDPVAVPATGVVDYKYVIVEPRLDEDLWVDAIEIRPTAPEVTHHVLVIAVPDGVTPEQALNTNDGVEDGYFAVYVPGSRPNLFPAGAAKELAAGTRFLVQLHYTPSGVATSDQTQIALRFAKEPAPTEVFTRGIAGWEIRIPPNKRDVAFQSTWRADWPVAVLSLFPHMHARGQSFRYELLDADGDLKRVLLDVPAYDFNWQDFYRFAEPVRVEEDEAIRITAVYDNTSSNPNNPDPSKTVTWGDQTFEEMMIGYFDYVDLDFD